MVEHGFEGHILPGVFFGFFGLWWSFVTSLRFVQTKIKRPQNKNTPICYHSSVTMPCVCLPCKGLSRLPIESFIKVFFCSAGVIGEIITGIEYRQVPKNKNFTSMGHDHDHEHKREVSIFSSSTSKPEMIEELWMVPGNGQHITIYTPFIIGGVVELLRYKKYDVPAKLEWFLGSLAFLIEAFIFGYHLHGKDPLDVHMHILLIYVILGCFLFSCLETYNPNEILFTYGRILCTIWQATWFVEIGFVIFTPQNRPDLRTWDAHDLNDRMLITLSFMWHMFAIVLFLFIQINSMKVIYSLLKKISPDLDERLIADQTTLDEKMYKFQELVNEEENFIEKCDSLRLNVKQSTSSGNSSLNSFETKISP